MPAPHHPPRAEAELYAPVKALLERHGYAAKGEVRGCDVVAVGPAPEDGGEPPLVVVEMKRAVTLAALLQAADRFALTDLVYLAVPAPPGAAPEGPAPAAPAGPAAIGPYTPRLHRLCRRLGLGLIAVEPMPCGGAIAVPVLDPGPPCRGPRRNRGRAALVRREHARRLGDPNRGGTPGGVRLVTAYRQAALRCAAALRACGGGPLPVRAVRETAEIAEAGRILYRNVYGWFEPVGRDLYRLTEAGARDLALLGPRAGLAEEPLAAAAE
jgi:hypothetical protein